MKIFAAFLTFNVSTNQNTYDRIVRGFSVCDSLIFQIVYIVPNRKAFYEKFHIVKESYIKSVWVYMLYLTNLMLNIKHKWTSFATLYFILLKIYAQ